MQASATTLICLEHVSLRYPMAGCFCLVQPLTSFCQHQPGEISCVSVSCFPVEPVPSPSQSQLWSKPRGWGDGWRERWGGGRQREGVGVGKGVEVIENCGHDCSNPVISPAKAGHSSDLETQMLSCLCLSLLSCSCSCSFHSSLLYLTLFSQPHWMSGGGLGSARL